ncbi:hypothetical protein Stsp01_66430 [Streptomyces sp. NBRC 13847]|nr:hypothetical protein Stsp01_66430 [Streptomyces sp. NBRC 13847]
MTEGRNDSKHHLVTDAAGIPLAAILAGSKRHDVTQCIPDELVGELSEKRDELREHDRSRSEEANASVLAKPAPRTS